MTTGPGITERCTPDQPCPKSLDPAGVSWADGCWCYRNPNEPATVWVVVSDCGLNGPYIHGVVSEEPDQAVLDASRLLAARMTGYQNTTVEVFKLDGPWQ